MNHRKIMRIAEDNLLDILTGKARVTNIPENSTIEFCGTEPFFRGVGILISNEAFPEILPYAEYERFIAEIEVINEAI